MLKMKISYEDFENYIIALRNTYDFENGLMDLSWKYNGDLGICLLPNCASHLFTLLEQCMGDTENGWISYFCYELDFGRDWKPGMITDIDGNDIKLQTIKNLFDYIQN